MRTCEPCRMTFETDARFLRHLVELHGAPRARVARSLRDFAGADLVAVQSTDGHWSLMVQAYLL